MISASTHSLLQLLHDVAQRAAINSEGIGGASRRLRPRTSQTEEVLTVAPFELRADPLAEGLSC